MSESPPSTAPQEDDGSPFRVAVLQRVIPTYRVPLFRLLGRQCNWRVKLLVGWDVPGSKVRSTQNLAALDVQILQTRFWHFGKTWLLYHRGLLHALGEYAPEAIICEGESNLMSYLQAVVYRWKNPDVALVHWSLGGMPGSGNQSLWRRAIKRCLLRLFDSFVVYSTFGKKSLMSLGVPDNAVFVATNVADIGQSLTLPMGTAAVRRARSNLGLPDRFTVLYVGALDGDKRVDTLLTAALEDGTPFCNVLIVGEGPERPQLEALAREWGSRAVYFLGRKQGDELSGIFRAANVFVLPGRGGIVISEAMAYGIPVVAHQADGSELDLVIDGETGYLLRVGDANDLRAIIKLLSTTPEECERMGANARAAVASRYTTSAMVTAIQAAVDSGIARRKRYETNT